MADPHAPFPVTAPPGPGAPDLPNTNPDDHHSGIFKIYMIVALVLAVCTAASFVVNYAVRDNHLGVVTGFLLILAVATLKACLVGYYFMHLKWDWRLLYFIIVPAFILGAMMVVILMPDTVIGPYRDAAELLEAAAPSAAPPAP